MAAAPAAGAAPVELRAPRVVATGVAIALRGSASPGTRVAVERLRGSGWRTVRTVRTDSRARFRADYVPRPASRRLRLRARVLADGQPGATSQSVVVRTRDVVLAAVGDVNLGDGPASEMARRGLRWPWLGTARVLRAADVAFGNLECAISRRGRPVPKQFRFRGSPAALRTMGAFAGFDVLNLANNHIADFGWPAFYDTLRYVRRYGMVGVGAGGKLATAARPRVVTRLGLRIAFVGFSEILPLSFFAGREKPGTVFASPAAVRAGVTAARRRADVVVATFHWGVELAGRENARQRMLAATALRSGATAVIGAHPHVLQPIVRPSHRLVAYSLGNFVFSQGGGAVARTGVLVLRLSARGVEGARLRRATIASAQPRFD
jgi:poly-gamma-glutamate synthesis protein (capsule biosynthesis protein)